MRRRLLIITVGLAVALATGHLWAQAPTASAALVAAAKREGSVALYTSLAPSESQPLAQAFEKKYGIKVDMFMARGPELRERMRVEAMTGRFLGDVQHNASSTTMTMCRPCGAITISPMK